MASLIYNVIMFAFQAAKGAQGPPPPGSSSSGGGGTTNAPELPLDENLWILLAMGILFGIYIIYRKNRAINKAA
ncbi:hypothetical protein Aeqsu_1134 [Aequorivita sublithincola DSM 14238]|uniref:Uncharacterized protein n=1 Tax=Aequorivita sublithincola (strain DSM 14238 / LMG 21431 / ACAM 643 / 9-3) TaxID=746697 RepID=I3YUG4_AEQSU|nr:hypothetical protein [Aequorivita sublithincola]AFL80632.1 hypothetical protein Aeqsu_1134 [Aequorivita sublithincola DSM 14238]